MNAPKHDLYGVDKSKLILIAMERKGSQVLQALKSAFWRFILKKT